MNIYRTPIFAGGGRGRTSNLVNVSAGGGYGY